jgi:hypothetical protein
MSGCAAHPAAIDQTSLSKYEHSDVHNLLMKTL